MRRRVLVALVTGAAVAWPVGARGQPQSGAKVYGVAVLFPAGDEPGARQLIEALAARGYVPQRNVTYHMRAAGQETGRLPRLARELVAQRPDVIVTATEPAARALTDATREIPIVMAVIGDPVALGITQSLARPTGNVTGFTSGHETIAAKRLELSLEVVPAARVVALLWVSTNTTNRLSMERSHQAAATLKVGLVSLPVAVAEDIPPAIDKAQKEGAAVLLVAADPLTIRNRRTIIDECLLRNLPAMHSYALEVRDGALISYGSDVAEDYGRVAGYVDRILKGAKIAELPFQEPTRFGLSINLRTAQALGLTIPPSILARADEVIE
ncbi:MAG TPA: ABC transporter substrate-binding protein [Vineibacter sp.]|nr:ABC transporter substrate-binding protein [Vineibacter sp.]